jgi:hypothetical protein
VEEDEKPVAMEVKGDPFGSSDEGSDDSDDDARENRMLVN